MLLVLFSESFNKTFLYSYPLCEYTSSHNHKCISLMRVECRKQGWAGGQPTEVVKKLHTAIPNDTRKMFSLDAMPLVPFSFLSDDQWHSFENVRMWGISIGSTKIIFAGISLKASQSLKATNASVKWCISDLDLKVTEMFKLSRVHWIIPVGSFGKY